MVEPVLEMMLLFDAQPALRSRLPQIVSINLVMQQAQVGCLCFVRAYTSFLSTINVQAGASIGLEVEGSPTDLEMQGYMWDRCSKGNKASAILSITTRNATVRG